MARKKKSGSLAYIIFFLLLIIAAVIGYRYIPTSWFPSEPGLDGPLKVTFLDIGQADSTIVQVGSSSMLIDAGSNDTSNILINAISKLGINKFDVVIGTHPHEDHIGGLDTVINRFDIGQIYMPEISANTETFREVLEAIDLRGYSVTPPVPGFSFSLGESQCTILAPDTTKYAEVNDYSIVIRLVYEDTSFLFSSDGGQI
jgi:competence protein ComEC